MSIDSTSSAKRLNLERASNFMRQFRDPDSRELKKLSANQFMEVWSHYDGDGNGYIEGTELDGFLKEFVSSANFHDFNPEMKFLVVIAVALATVGVCDFAAVLDESEVIPKDFDAEFLSTDSTVDVIPYDIIGELIKTGTEIELLPSDLDVLPGARALEYASIAARNTLLTRIRLTVAGAANVVRVRDISFSSARTITAWRASEILPSQGARAWLLSGGVGRTQVTVRYQSLVGRGLNVQLEVWGR